jgi:hypothetical protein
MADLPNESIRRIDFARRQNEAELQRALSAVPESDDYECCLSPFEAFAVALYDSGVDELLTLCTTGCDFQAQRKELAQRVIEDIMPNRGLNAAWANMPDELKRVSIVYEVATGRLFEGKPEADSFGWEEDNLTPARPEARAFERHYGYWERFAPERVRFALRSPSANAKVREALRWAIHRREGFWADQFQSRMSAPGSGERDERIGSEMGRAELLPPGTQPKPRKRGPKPDFDTAAQVAEIVAKIAPDGDWRTKLDDICKALDNAQIPFPLRWQKRDRCCEGWADYDERANAVKAIEYRLKLAKQRKKATPETLS